MTGRNLASMCLYIFGIIMLKSIYRSLANVEICFPKTGVYKNFYPPHSVPQDPKEIIYSVSLDQVISRPIIAQLCEEEKEIPSDHDDYSNQKAPRYFTIESLDPEIASKNQTNDPLQGKLRLCQYASNNFPINEPRRYDKSQHFSRKICPEYAEATLNITFFKNLLVAQGLFHQLTEIPPGHPTFLRVFRFKYMTTDCKLIYKDTEPFEIITNPADGLNWITAPPSQIIANNPFDIKLEIVDKARNVIKTGLDSTLFVEVTIGYSCKHFLVHNRVEQFLYFTKVMMEGRSVITSVQNYDRILRKRADKGVVEFKDVHLLDVTKGPIFLNATLIVPRTNIRQPDNYDDLKPACYSMVDAKKVDNSAVPGLKVITFKHGCIATMKKLKAVVFSDAIVVTPQTPHKLQLLATKPSTATVNFEVPNLFIEVLDGSDRRVHSGPGSSLLVTIQSSKNSLCVKNPTFRTSRGLGKFAGSVCENAVGITFTFKAEDILETAPSAAYSFTNDIRIAMFGHLSITAGDLVTDPNAATFAEFAVEDINKGYYSKELPNLKDKTIVLENYDTTGDSDVVFNKVSRIISLPESEVAGSVNAIIGFGSNDILEAVAPLLEMHEVPVISYVEDNEGLSAQRSQAIYRTITPISWNSISVAINLVLMLKYRAWDKIVVIASSEHPIPHPIYQKFLIFNIGYKLISIPCIPVNEWTSDGLRKELELISEAGTNIIFHYVHAPMQYYLYRQAIRFGYAPIHGYQWITIQTPAFHFFRANEHKVCTEEIPWCDKGMEGMILVRGTYGIHGFSTDIWYRVNERYYGMDAVLHYGTPTSTMMTESGAIALGYDAVLTLAYAFNSLYKPGSEPISGWSIVNEINKVQFIGLTGKVSYDDHRRIGFIGEISSVESRNVDRNGTSTEIKWTASRWAHLPRELEIYIINNREAILDWGSGVDVVPWNKSSRLFNEPFEINSQMSADTAVFAALAPQFWHSEVVLTVPVTGITDATQNIRESMILKLPKSARSNTTLRFYVSKVGRILSETRQLLGDSEVALSTEYLIHPFSCERGCGGEQLHALDSTDYQHGRCESINYCRCKTVGEVFPDFKPVEKLNDFAYYDDTCNSTVCKNCVHGNCTLPLVCTCNDGWTGDDCNTAICKETCVHGDCVAPGKCACHIGYHGATCNILLGIIVMSVLLILLASVSLLLFCLRWRQKRNVEKKELLSFAWLVEWEDVKQNIAIRATRSISREGSLRYVGSSHSERALAGKDTSVENLGLGTSSGRGVVIQHQKYSGRYVEWHDQECFMQKFDRPSLDVYDKEVRLEVIHLKELKHPNLVHFIGVCLTHPNVCLLVEIVPKGSLDEILQSSTFKITWSFKYSILRDICIGMDYLHGSKISSHGRLKSPNCLIDNRWTCKISGFGIPTIRHVEYSISEFSALQQAMLWTAPELLRVCSTPNDVGRGTKVGDSYSLGIIITEMYSHERPWNAELKLLSVEEILLLLRNRMDPANLGVKRVLEMNNYDTSKPLRPVSSKTFYPIDYNERKAVQRLTFDLLNEDITKRPTIKETLTRLSSIHPFKGELVENLIHMLEKYTNHLEEVLAEKMLEVKSEQMKTEELISRILPASIADQLKHNIEVKPQTHDNVSIFFSDIKGFTAIAKVSTPMQVVALLNQFYVVFDNIIDRYSAYKLETIGDAYCVVSGIPTPNLNHAVDLTSMALDISSEVLNFPIPHLPGKMLECRIGINSGSVVTGVLGIKMPRYCIFGVDVVIASQMESSGEIHRVHVSEQTAILLKTSDKFILHYRGIMQLKSVGPMKTYFVTYKKQLYQQLKESNAKAQFSTGMYVSKEAYC